MATRAIKRKREETLVSDWQSRPERAPSLVRSDQPLAARIVALFSLMLVVLGFLAMVVNPDGFLGGLAQNLGVGWGMVFFSLGLGGLLYHSFRDSERQYRVLYTLAGLVLLLLGAIFLVLPDRNYFLTKGAPALGLGLLFLVAVVRQETQAKPRRLILLLLGLLGAFFALVGLVGCTVSKNFLVGEGVVWLILGLPFLCAYIGQEDTSREGGYWAAAGMGMVGGLAFAIALVRSLWPIFSGVRAPSEAYLVPHGFTLLVFGLLYLLIAIGICADWAIVVLTRRELSAFFYSPVAYLVTLGIMAVGFVMFVSFLSLMGRGVWEPIVRYLFFSFYPVVCVMFLVPALTMRLLSEESRTGTLEVLLTAPVNETAVVLSKFFAALVFYLLALSPWLVYLLALRLLGGKPFDYRPLLSFFLALVCSGAGFVSVGLFFSSLSRNQIIAAVLTFVAMIGFTSSYILSGQQMLSPPWNDIFSYTSYLDLWWSSLDGLFVPRNLLFHLSLSVFFLFLTTKVLEARKWS